MLRSGAEAGQPQAGRSVRGGQWTAQGGHGTPGEEVNADLSATEGLSAGRAGKMVCTFKKLLWLRRGGEQRYKCRRLWLVLDCEQLGGAKTLHRRIFYCTFRTDFEGFLSSVEWMGMEPFSAKSEEGGCLWKESKPRFPLLSESKVFL